MRGDEHCIRRFLVPYRSLRARRKDQNCKHGKWALPSLSRTSTGDAQAASNQRKSRLAMDGACGEKLLENFADAKHHTEHSLQMVKRY